MSDEITSDKNASSATDASVSSPLSERISKLEQKHHRENATAPQATIPKGGMALAGRVSSELVAGLVVGAGSGWVLDRWLDTSPLLLAGMFFFSGSFSPQITGGGGGRGDTFWFLFAEGNF